MSPAATGSTASRFARAWAMIRDRGVSNYVRQVLRRRGVHCFRYHYIRERLPETGGGAAAALPPGFRFEVFGAAEVDVICTWADQGAPMTGEGVRQSFERGNGCLGIKQDGNIIAFSWYALEETHSQVHPAVMGPNEAYLFNIYVRPEARGHNLAPLLRTYTYEVLSGLGKDTFYSITALHNKASWRFKEKLGAEKVLLGLYLNFRDWHRNWVLWRY